MVENVTLVEVAPLGTTPGASTTFASAPRLLTLAGLRSLRLAPEAVTRLPKKLAEGLSASARRVDPTVR